MEDKSIMDQALDGKKEDMDDNKNQDIEQDTSGESINSVEDSNETTNEPSFEKTQTESITQPESTEDIQPRIDPVETAAIDTITKEPQPNVEALKAVAVAANKKTFFR